MIVLDDTSIMNLSYSHDYQRAVEETQIALQQVERAKYRVQQAEE